MSFAEIQVELLRAEFPSLRPDHDPDIERYFDMRAAGRPGDALHLYDTRIRGRYPDDDFRTRLLRAYRLSDPAFAVLLSSAYADLGLRLLERVKRTIKYIALRAENFDPTDVYSTIKAAESILAMLPRERFEAIAAAERLRRYADLMEYCRPAMATAEDLVRAYLTESLDVVEGERRRRKTERERGEARRKELLVARDRRDIGEDAVTRYRRNEEERERTFARRSAAERSGRKSRSVSAMLDLSGIRFSAADLSRIQIPPVLTSLEDRTLAFCFKYWNAVGDAAFERVLFLYSRKFGTKHYDVFQHIRQGRRAGHRDEEILSAVSSQLITGYYYSISGDAYIQRNWARLKTKLDGAQSAVPSRPVAGLRRRSLETRAMAASALSAPSPTPAKATAAKTDAALPAIERNVSDTDALTAAAPSGQAAQAARPVFARAAATRPAIVSATVPQRSDQPKPVSGGSVSDRLRKLAGRSYDVYEDRFLSKARQAIRRVLARNRGNARALFVSVPQEAEDALFGFLRDHYSDPYMDWTGSAQRSRLAELGFELESVDEIIADCFSRL